MHCEAMIERGWGSNWRPRLSELRDALGGGDRGSLDMNLPADRARLEEYLEAVDLE